MYLYFYYLLNNCDNMHLEVKVYIIKKQEIFSVLNQSNSII